MNTDNVREDRAFEERTKLLFDESVAGLDAATRSKLTRARHRALEELEASAPVGWRPQWIPAGVVAAVLVGVLLLWQGQPAVSPDGQAFDVAALSDLEILLGEEDLDMIQELEFYAWLDEQADTAPVDGGVG